MAGCLETLEERSKGLIMLAHSKADSLKVELWGWGLFPACLAPFAARIAHQKAELMSPQSRPDFTKMVGLTWDCYFQTGSLGGLGRYLLGTVGPGGCSAWRKRWLLWVSNHFQPSILSEQTVLDMDMVLGGGTLDSDGDCRHVSLRICYAFFPYFFIFAF